MFKTTYQTSAPHPPHCPSLPSSTDPQAYSVKPPSGPLPTIQVDLASPQSPDSVDIMSEFKQAKREVEEEDQGLVMSPADGPSRQGEGDTGREQKLMRCLSDPGPSADEDEDEPFLP